MPRRSRFPARTGVLTLLGALALGAPATAAQRTVLAGVVRDSAARVGVMGAEVSLEGTGVRVLTDARGEFRIPLAGGAGALRVRRLGFRPRFVPLAEVADDSLLEVVLVAAAQRLPVVQVQAHATSYTGRLAGYYERLERKSIGQFITRADIEQERPRQLTELLQRRPGIQVQRGRAGGSVPYVIRMRGRQCWPLVWLDGVAMSAGDVDLDAFPPTTIEGIELYLGANSAPARFQSSQGRSECGTIVLWSRGPDTDPVGRTTVSAEQFEEMIRAATVFTEEEVDRPAALDSAHRTPVVYPQALRATGLSGVVVAEFVVDQGGGVEMDNIGAVGATHPLFLDAVRDALRTTLFRPALRGGEPVRQLVRQAFEFHLPGR